MHELCEQKKREKNNRKRLCFLIYERSNLWSSWSYASDCTGTSQAGDFRVRSHVLFCMSIPEQEEQLLAVYVVCYLLLSVCWFYHGDVNEIITVRFIFHSSDRSKGSHRNDVKSLSYRKVGLQASFGETNLLTSWLSLLRVTVRMLLSSVSRWWKLQHNNLRNWRNSVQSSCVVSDWISRIGKPSEICTRIRWKRTVVCWLPVSK